MSKKTAWIVLAACGVALVLLLGAAVLLSGREKEQLRARGVPVIATVVDKTSRKVGWRSGSGDVIEYCVGLSFRTREDKPASGNACQHVGQEIWSRLRVGDKVEALYLPLTTQGGSGDTLRAEVYLQAGLAP
jgi:hypothetical protein